MATRNLQVVVRATDQASATVRGIASRMVGSFRSVLSVGADVSLVITGIARAAQTLHRVVVSNEAAQRLDNIGKAARRLGESTQYISKLTYAADLSDVPFEKLNIAAEKLQENIGKIAGGTAAKEVLTWFDRLDVRLRDNLGNMRSMEQLLPEIADAMGRLQPAERVAAARQLFGRGSGGILNVLEGGPRGLAEGFREAERLGVVYSRRLTDAAEEYNDSITRVSQAWLGVKATVIGEVGPALTDFFNAQAFRIAQIPNAVRGIGRTIREMVSEDPAAASQARARVRELALSAVDVLYTGVVAILKIGGQVLVESALVAFEASSPRIAETVRDIAAPTLNWIPGINIELSDQAKLTALRQRRAELEGVAARTTAGVSDPNGVFGRFVAQGMSSELATFDAEIASLTRRIEPARKAQSRALTAVLQSAGSNIAEMAREQFAELQGAKDRLGTILDEFTTIGIDYRAAHEDFLDAHRPREQVQSFDNLTAGAVRYAVALKDRVVTSLKSAREELATVSPLIELRARGLDAAGNDRAAGRLRLVAQQQAELRQSLLGGRDRAYMEQLREVQTLERSRYDVETRATAVLDDLTKARERYGDVVARNAGLVEAGTIRQDQATRQNLQSAESVRRLGEAAKAQIDTIITANPALAKFLEEYRDNVIRILGEIPTPRVSADPTFGDGVRAGIDQLIERANDFRAQGLEAFELVADIGVNRLASSLTQAKFSFSDFARSALKDIAELTTRMLLLRGVSAGLKAFGFGAADAASTSAFVAGTPVVAPGLNRGGIVPSLRGFAGGGGFGPDFRLLGGPNVNRDTGVFRGTPGELVISRDQVRRNGGHAGLVAGLNRGAYGPAGDGHVAVTVNQHVTINGAGGGGGLDSKTLESLRKAARDGTIDALERSPAYRARFRGALG